MPYRTPDLDRFQLGVRKLDLKIGPAHLARIIDAVVDGLDLKKIEIDDTPALRGRRAYDPRDLLKLHLYGNFRGIRSSRRLEEACRDSISMRWLMKGSEPKHQTIAEFRKQYKEELPKLFDELVEKLRKVVDTGFLSQDGTKFKANCARNQIYMKEDVEASIKHLAKYLAQFDENDDLDSEREVIQAAKAALQAEKAEVAAAKEALQAERAEVRELAESAAAAMAAADAKMHRSCGNGHDRKNADMREAEVCTVSNVG